MIVGVNHIGIAVSSIEEVLKIYHDAFGFQAGKIEDGGRGFKIVFVSAGNTQIEFLQPVGAESDLAKFIERRGEGVHHLALETDNIEAEIQALKQKGISPAEEKPRIGSSGNKGIFLHPKGTRRVLIELVEPKK